MRLKTKAVSYRMPEVFCGVTPQKDELNASQIPHSKARVAEGMHAMTSLRDVSL